MKKRYLLAFFISAGLGALQHFGYEWLPCPLTALLCPINESVWEHLKLLYWPVLLTGFYVHHKKLQSQRAWSGTLFSMLLTPLMITGMFYTLYCGFSVYSVAADVAAYFVILAIGFLIAYKVEKNGSMARFGGVLVILVGLYGAALILFTLAPPDLPIFRDIFVK